MRHPAIPRDTSEEAYHVQIEALRRLGPEGRLKLGFELSGNLHRIVEDGIRSRHPDYTDDMVRMARIRLTVGDRLYRQAYPGQEVEP